MICSVRASGWTVQDGRLKPAAAGRRAAASHPEGARANISVIQGAGGNITVLTFPEGITLVDTGSAPNDR